jgi:hypothetical protein
MINDNIDDAGQDMVFGKRHVYMFSDWYVFYSNDNKCCQDGRKVQHKKKCEK